MPAPNKITNEEILDALRKRDRRQRPAVTASHVANGFDVHTRTMKRHLDELVEEGEVSCVKYAAVTVYWSNAVASCAECGADLYGLDNYDLGCYQCGSVFIQKMTPDGLTPEMKMLSKATDLSLWWLTLPKSLRSLFTTMASLLAPLRSQGFTKYEPGMLRYDHEKREVYVERDDAETDSDVEDTDDERRLVIGVKGDGLAIFDE